MKVLGLTGGIGMGKSACEDLLRARAVPVVDTDRLARELVEPGQPALAEIRQRFGPEILDSAGQLRRQELARRVFGDPAGRQDLERLLHPRIKTRWRAIVEAWRAQGLPLAVVVIPLLFETGAEAELDATICVACSPGSQRRRLLARGWTADHLAQRIAAQWPVETKMARASYVIWSEGSLEVHAAQLARILAAVSAGAGGAGR